MTNLLLITNSIVFRPFSWEVIIAFVVILLLLVVSGLISASEVAYFSLSPNNLNTIDSDEHNKYDTVKELRNKPEDLLATILITNNFVNVAIIILSTYCLQRLFDFSTAKVWGFIIETVIITFILLMFGEIMPKIYAKQHALKTVVFMAKTIKRLHRFLKPMVNILVGSTKFVNKRMAKHQTNNLSMDELQQALELTTGTIDGEKQILKGIATFGELNVEAIMTSRLDMVMLEMSTPYRQVIENILKYEYSRIPVYTNSSDNIRGVLYIKDLIPHLNKGNNFKWQTLIRPPYFVPETKKIDDLLQEFQKNRIHIAIVVDEFGGTSGLVTLEDILEEVVGDIEDEYDHETKLYKKIDDLTYLFEAKILLTDFFKATLIAPEDFAAKTSEVDTLAGLVLELKGDFPELHEKIQYKNYTFEVTSVDARRIKQIKFHINPLKEEENEKSQ